MTQKSNKSTGFSLIELAVIMAIMGLIMAGLIQTYKINQRFAQDDNTNARMNEITSAIMLYLAENGRYPCPAGRALPQDDAAYGREGCPDSNPLSVDFVPLGTCTNGLCRVAGQRVVSNTGAVLNPGDPGYATNLNLSAVLIGTVPFKELNTALNLSRQNVFDGWGHAFTYAVTERFTVDKDDVSGQGYNPLLGTIRLSMWRTLVGAEEDSSQDTYAQITTPDNSQEALLISHGPDGMGTYTSNGILIAPCASGADLQRDSENCDNDSEFSMVDEGLLNVGVLFTHEPGPTHFDDYVRRSFTLKSGHWKTSEIDPDNIRTSVAQLVGIGDETPDAVIDVAGNIRVGNPGGVLGEGDLMTDVVCNQDTDDCFDPQLIGGTGMSCPNLGQSMVGIANSSPECDFTAMQGVNPGTCPSGQFIVGFNGSGDIICAAPGL